MILLKNLDDSVRPNREASHSFDRRGTSMESKTLGRKLSQAAQMLDDRDSGREQERMGRAGTIVRIVDV
jgi:uncharacterized membrane protein YccC